MTDKLVRELVDIGLAEKEARVYLASLELGPETAQKIAAKAQVSRPNTYIAIEALTKRGLMSSYLKGKKKYYSCESPELLNNIFKKKYDSVLQKKEDIDILIPRLLSMTRLAEMPNVRMLEGEDGLRYVQKDILKAKGMVLNIVSLDSVKTILPPQELRQLWKQMKQAGIEVRTLYTKELGTELFGESLGCKWESRRLPSDMFQYKGEMTIYNDKVAGFTFGGRSVGILMESNEIAGIVRTMFNLAWEASEKYQ